MEVVDLDLLRPEPKIIKLGGKEIDASFIPCGVTFEIDKIMREMSTLNADEVTAGGDVTALAFDLSIRMCAVYCQCKYPEMDEAWFKANATAGQIQKLTTVLREALVAGYKEVEAYSKNVEAVKQKK